MRILALAMPLLLVSLLEAQTDRGTITGTLSDPAGAVVVSAEIEAHNVATGAVFQVQSTATGNFTLAQLPTGPYELVVTVVGFKRFVRQNIDLGVAQTLRIDVNLEVGSATESVTVSEAAPLLRTESGELSHNVAVDRMNALPVMGIGAGAGSAGIRNPYAVVQMIPGAYWVPNSIVRINGAPNNTQSFRVEGQDASNGFTAGVQAQVQPSVEAIQEFAIQTSNFAAEFGQVGGGFFNVTMKSGSNQVHGTGYDYFVNEALNAGTPFTVDPRGRGLIRPVQRRNNYGFTFSGPVYIPKVYNGHDKTFFFFNFEQYREIQTINNTPQTVPTLAYREGNFATARTTRQLATDPLGRPIVEGTIYDPLTQRAAPNGQIIRDPFPNNVLPASQMDTVALRVQNLIPLPTSSGLINNYLPSFQADRVTGIPAFKIDHQLGSKGKLSFYYSRTSTASQYTVQNGGADGLPLPITAAVGSFQISPLYRLNYDHTLSPTLLLHLGAGYQGVTFDDRAPVTSYDAEKELGLRGATTTLRFPAFQNMTNAQGGMKNMGPNSARVLWYYKPTANASLTWVRGNHTYKTGAEMRIEAYPGVLNTATNGIYQFSAAESGLPSTNGQNLSGGSVGFPYASFMMGAVNSVTVSNPTNLRPTKSQWGFFVQDTWKVTRKFTLDYGLRYDYATYIREAGGRFANFSPTTSNPAAGGQLGAVAFEGDGPGRCNCSFAKNYPYAFAPRLGAAYQLTPKTVMRLGWGIVFSGTADSNGATSGLTTNNPFPATSFGDPAMLLRNGIPFTPPPWPNYDVGQFPLPGALTPPRVWIDQNAGRPARQIQWSIGLQRELTRNLMVEAAYVGNRGVWWNAPGLIDVNALTPDRIRAAGLDINSAADRTLLQSPLNSAVAASRGFSNPPYSGFPVSSTVAQALRPFPQFLTIIPLWAPVGNTWYDSLQVKGTQRFSRGLQVSGSFTWQKELVSGSETNINAGTTGNAATNDVFNRPVNKYISQFSRPLLFNLSLNYTVPKVGGKVVSWVVRDWTVGAYVQYASGLPIQSPLGQNQLASHLFRTTFANRVPGEPLFTQDMNCHCFDPNRTFVLNPAAWAEPAGGQFGTAAAYYNDYRFQRRPVENFNFGRTFRLWEGGTFNIRAEFTNIFNRTQPNNPVANNARQTQTFNNAGQTTAGFGFINTGTVFSPSRQGVIVGRFQF